MLLEAAHRASRRSRDGFVATSAPTRSTAEAGNSQNAQTAKPSTPARSIGFASVSVLGGLKSFNFSGSGMLPSLFPLHQVPCRAVRPAKLSGQPISFWMCSGREPSAISVRACKRARCMRSIVRRKPEGSKLLPRVISRLLVFERSHYRIVLLTAFCQEVTGDQKENAESRSWRRLRRRIRRHHIVQSQSAAIGIDRLAGDVAGVV